MPDDAERLRKRRFRIVKEVPAQRAALSAPISDGYPLSRWSDEIPLSPCSVWKPLATVTSWPLAVCDSTTVREEDFVTTDLVRRKYFGETFYARFNPNHKWYYVSNQQPDEVTLLKIFDSDETRARRSDVGTIPPTLPHFPLNLHCS
jgi:hypothetical protein